jgi:hypothetical protein
MFSGFREGGENSEMSPGKEGNKATGNSNSDEPVSGGKDSDYTIMVDVDKMLQLLIQVVVTRISYVEER